MVMTGVWREKRVFFILEWRAVIPPSQSRRVGFGERVCLAIAGKSGFGTARCVIGDSSTSAVWSWCERTSPCLIVPCATQRMTWESIRWERVAKDGLHAMECCGGEGRARVRICGVVRRALCWLALLYACFQSGLLVLCSSAMYVVVFVVEPT